MMKNSCKKILDNANKYAFAHDKYYYFNKFN